MSAQDVIDRIRDFAREHKLKPATFARMAGLHPNALRDMHSDAWRPRLDTMQKLERVVDQAQPAEPTDAAD